MRAGKTGCCGRRCAPLLTGAQASPDAGLLRFPLKHFSFFFQGLHRAFTLAGPLALDRSPVPRRARNIQSAPAARAACASARDCSAFCPTAVAARRR
ncbi:hypothetical protein CG434_21680 [Pantoea ananatis]|nr:hypothetical protein CG434_21680 [Pantoea ananatis]